MLSRQMIYENVKSFRGAINGPHILAFLPAITLGAFWLGGESALLVVALLLPAALGLVGGATARIPPPEARDGLTGLHLRDAVEGALDTSLESQPKSGLSTACLQVELDDFRDFTDRFGRKAAEDILVRASERILGALRSNDVMARLDGGSFSIAVAPIRRADLENLIQMGSRIQSTIAEPFSLDATNVYLTASIGFCLSTRTSIRSGSAMLEAAECALFEARRHGPGGLRAFSPEMKKKAEDQSALIGEVGAALEAGQIQPWFQPQVSTDTGEISGFEALARWSHPTRGIVSPAEFLPAIQQAGLSERLSEIILFHALSALRSWDQTGIHIPRVGVNFSSEELRNPKLVEKIRWELDRFDMTADRLSVEILESVVAGSDDDTITRNISGLSKLGCGIDLDDFGTGHASIANIRRFAINRIKIDRSFVTKVDVDPEQNRMVSAILTMAERLEIETLAEGVESVGEHATLSQLGCGHVQGFGIGRPMPLSETVLWMEKHAGKLTQTPAIGRKQG
ncbi:putative bifunctional diguanylate cyclase/phosphodiesterase [Falsihalocynthiibacter sp. S25ZX9]|uniref:putative bifunctional diguanylate cyclase/phosphodiesterase n=1 Tax=Falsihalocynthiibacter sp. S25ZX9 TaxID=3240870 RepID=UPI00350FF9E4